MEFSTFEGNTIVALLHFNCAVPKYGQRACYNKYIAAFARVDKKEWVA